MLSMATAEHGRADCDSYVGGYLYFRSPYLQESNMPDIYSIPTETLVDIFERVHDVDKRGLLEVSLTSKKLGQVAQPILYRDICLPLDRLPHYKLSRLIHCANHDLIRSITLTAGGFLKETLWQSGINYDDLDSVYPFLSSLRQLHTFSINFDRKYLDYTDVFPSTVIERLLQSLPESVVNLELDTNGCDDINDGVHLCPTIRKLLPQLEVLRLRVSQLCTELMHSPARHSQRAVTPQYSRLRSVVIPLSLNHWYPRIRMFNVGPQRRVISCTAPNDPTGLSSASFAGAARDLFERGAFPRLRSFIITEDPGQKIGYHNTYRVLDIVANHSINVPHMRVKCHGLLIPLQQSATLVRDCSAQDLFASDEDIAAFLEGPLAWTELLGGARFPSLRAKTGEHELNSAALLDRATAGAKWWLDAMHTPLWECEQRVGCKVLWATIDEGLRG